MELTERCNNNCIHCCINKPEHNAASLAGEMPTAQCKELIRQAVDLGALTVRFTGGEPLLRDDFAEIYLYARRSGLRVVLFTNGRLITPRLADLFARIPPLARIEVSTYGMSQECYEKISRTRNSFSEYQEGLKRLSARRIPFIVKGTLLSINSHEADEFSSWSTNLPGADPLPFFSLFLELRHRRDSAAKNKFISSLRLSPKEAIAVLAQQPEIYWKDVRDYCRTFLSSPTDSVFNCNAGNSVSIDAYGRIQYCLGLRHPDTVLESREYNLEYAVKEFFPRLIERRSCNREFLLRCAKCFLRGLCEQCPAKSWSENGSLDQPTDYWCQIAHEQAKFLGLISEGEHAWKVRNWRRRIKRLDEVIKGKHSGIVSIPRIKERKNEFQAKKGGKTEKSRSKNRGEKKDGRRRKELGNGVSPLG